jgi:D-3-phosphoglycerate dehydrogenase / 2-oxoglutarate reductase
VGTPADPGTGASAGAVAVGSADRPRVVVLDPITDVPWDYDLERAVLGPAGVDLVIPSDDDEGEAAARAADVVIVSGLRRLDAPLIRELHRSVGILCYSVGMDKVDAQAAAEAGIPVRNVPGYCTDEVADHALALLLAAWRRVPGLATRAAAYDWAVHADPELAAIRRLRGHTLGVVGAGRIGRQVAERARAFGMRTIAADPFVTDAGPELPVLPLGEVLAGADALVLCAALTSATRWLIGRDELASVRSGLVLVNVARGGLIDERALADALRDGRVAFAALDVRDPEPPRPDADALAGLTNVLQTPHVGGASQEATADLHRMAAEICLEMLAAGGRGADA